MENETFQMFNEISSPRSYLYSLFKLDTTLLIQPILQLQTPYLMPLQKMYYGSLAFSCIP